MALVERIKKAPSGIVGLDELTEGGLPAGRATLLCGGPGCGKTLLATTFLVTGAHQAEPGLFLSFDEKTKDLNVNAASVGFDLAALQEQNLLAVDHVFVDRQQFEETGEYDLEGLFVRLDHAVQRIGARRVVIDSIDTLFAGIPNQCVVRSELRRLITWLKDRELSAIITAERGSEGALTRHGVEEYVSDCVIRLDHRLIEEVATRRLCVVKFRGSRHGTNEYPFLIDEDGITIFPVTSLRLSHRAYSEKVSTGIAMLDAMLDGEGCFKGSSVLLGGGPGTGKTSIAAHFADAACRGGRRCIYFSFEESPDQLLRNMCSIGVDLQPFVENGLLLCHASRPSLYGLEMHLAAMLKLTNDFHPDVVIIDPLSALLLNGSREQTQMMVLRLVDYFKAKGVTALFTTLQMQERETDLNVSSIMDTWLLVQNRHVNGELARSLHIVKARGMSHSAHVCRMEITSYGVRLSQEPERAAARDEGWDAHVF